MTDWDELNRKVSPGGSSGLAIISRFSNFQYHRFTYDPLGCPSRGLSHCFTSTAATLLNLTGNELQRKGLAGASITALVEKWHFIFLESESVYFYD